MHKLLDSYNNLYPQIPTEVTGFGQEISHSNCKYDCTLLQTKESAHKGHNFVDLAYQNYDSLTIIFGPLQYSILQSKNNQEMATQKMAIKSFDNPESCADTIGV